MKDTAVSQSRSGTRAAANGPKHGAAAGAANGPSLAVQRSLIDAIRSSPHVGRQQEQFRGLFGAGPVLQRVLVIGKDYFYTKEELQKKKALWNQLFGPKAPSVDVQNKVLEWIASNDEHPQTPVKTMTDVIKAAKLAVEEEKSKTSSVLKEHVDEGEGKQEITIEEEKKSEKPSFTSSTGASLALELEKTVSEAEPSAKAYITQNASTLNGQIVKLQRIAQESEDFHEILQIHRFIGTFEFSDLCNHGKTKQKCLALQEAVLQGVETHGVANPKKLFQIIPSEWEITELILQTELKDRPHGKEEQEPKGITSLRLSQTFGEFQLCIPDLTKIWLLGGKCGFFTSPKLFAPLVIRVLEGTLRRFKLASILELLSFYIEHSGELNSLVENGRVLKEAEQGIHMAILLALQGEGHRSREQKKMLLALFDHLKHNPEDQCLEYEPDSGKANYDLMFSDESGGRKIVEVETIPEKERGKAYKFYKERYKMKLQSIKRGEEVLYIFIPAETLLPREQIELISNDEELKIINIDRIKPSD